MSTPLNNPKIAIIVLNWNGKKDTLACLESLKKLTYSSYDVIVVDNGSTDDSVNSIRSQFPEYFLLETYENLGFAEGNNVGIRFAMQRGAEFIFLLNNDTVVSIDILQQFLLTFENQPKAGILGAKIFLFDTQDTLDHLGGKWNPKKGLFEFVGLHQKDDGIHWQNPEKIDYVCGAGLIMRRTVIETVGYLEARFFLIWEEADFCFRARQKGFEIFTCPNARLWHKVSASFTGGKPHSTYFWWRNRLLWIERNCTFKEKIRIYLNILIPDIFHMLKIRALKQTQLLLFGRFQSEVKCKQKKQNLIKNKAALCGIRDYFLRRFGKGPAWIYKKL